MSRKSKFTAQMLTRLALLVSTSVVLGYIEGIICALMPLPPGVKLGLANTVVLYGIYTIGVSGSVMLIILKVILTGFMSGNLASAFLYSMGGAILSLVTMLLVKKLGQDKVSVVGVSVVGAVFHNVGQLLVAAFIMQTPGLMFYVFVLMFSAVITGTLTGLAGNQVIAILSVPGENGKREMKKVSPKGDSRK